MAPPQPVELLWLLSWLLGCWRSVQVPGLLGALEPSIVYSD